MIKQFFHKHWDGAGGIAALIPIAVPMIVSNIFDTVMMFMDRMYLSYVGKEHMASCMNAGLTAFSCMIFFVGVISYVSAMVARYYGAGQATKCPRIVFQGLQLGLLAYPLVVASGFVAVRTFAWAGHDPLQIKLETTYFWYFLLGGGILALLRAPLAAFFSGIGKTKIIMWASFAAMLVNLVFDYLLIFGKFGFPKLGIVGAALGTILASLTVTGILSFVFLRYSRKKEYRNLLAWKYDPGILRALLKFGIPNGVDSLLGTTAFNLAIAVFHGYGVDAAAAITIVMNWDLLSFFPLMGVQIAVTTLVSQNLGAGNLKGAERAAYSGCKLTVCYSLFIMAIFIGLPGFLVSLFTPESSGLDYSTVTKMAVPLLRWAACYLIFDGVYLAFSGALRGGGDTFWAMLIGLVFHWFLAANVLVTTYVLDFSLLGSWRVWVLSSVLGSTLIYWRFRQGHWKKIKFSQTEKVQEELPAC
ncbi:MAG: MATE family efflux transporter [Lentisphaeria bacterium]